MRATYARGMSDVRGGRPRDSQLHERILAVTRELLADRGYGELSMEGVAARAEVGKKTLYRRWRSKAPLVAEAVLDAYTSGPSFPVADTGDLHHDLRAWLHEHAAFIAEPRNAALIRAVIAAAAANPTDGAALYHQLSAPQHHGLTTRLRRAATTGNIHADTDIDAVADTLIGTLLLSSLTPPGTGDHTTRKFDGLLTAIFHGIAPTTSADSPQPRADPLAEHGELGGAYPR